MKDVKLPKHIIKELKTIADCSQKIDRALETFEDWVKENINEDFDFNTLRACADLGINEQTEALTEIEYGAFEDFYIEEIEKVLSLNRKHLKC